MIQILDKYFNQMLTKIKLFSNKSIQGYYSRMHTKNNNLI